jgi:hypothetical protein
VTGESVVNAALRGEAPIDEGFVAAVGELLASSHEGVRIALRGALRARGAEATGFEVRTGAWRLDLETAALKAVSCAVVSTLVLEGLGADSIPATVLSIVAPFLFEVQRVEVAAADVWVHAHMLEAAAGEELGVKALYDRLPPDVQLELSIPEFIGVVERLRGARLVAVGRDGVEVYPRGRERGFRLLLS